MLHNPRHFAEFIQEEPRAQKLPATTRLRIIFGLSLAAWAVIGAIVWAVL